MNAFIRRVLLKLSNYINPAEKISVKQVHLGGYSLLVMANEDVGRQIFYTRLYEPVETAFINSIIRTTDICFDIGANTGYYTFLLASLAKAGAVYSFEPTPLAYSLLNAGIVLNDKNNIFTQQLAISDVKGEVQFSKSTDSAFSAILPSGRKPEERKFTAPTISIDDFVNEHQLTKVDFIKIDVEGAEELVIRGGKRLFSDRNRRPRLLMIELFDQNLTVFDTDVPRIIELMDSFGYIPLVALNDRSVRRYCRMDQNKIVNVFFAQEHETFN